MAALRLERLVTKSARIFSSEAFPFTPISLGKLDLNVSCSLGTCSFGKFCLSSNSASGLFLRYEPGSSAVDKSLLESILSGALVGKRIKCSVAPPGEGKNKNPIKTHQRDLIILPSMIGVTINVFSGKEFTPITISAEMIGHYVGEYVITNKRVNHGAPGVGASRSSLYVPLK